MLDAIDVTQVKEILRSVASAIEAAKSQLCALDGAAGDGDLGITMVLGFRAVLKSIDGETDDMGSMLTKAAAAFAKAAPSSMGALLGAALDRAGQEVVGLSRIGTREIARMAQAAECGIRDRGKAELGDKTVLDVVAPAVAALVEQAERDSPLLEALERAAVAAKEGLERTTGMKSRRGRAAALGERTIGQPDPGAACACLILESIVGALRRESASGTREARVQGS